MAGDRVSGAVGVRVMPDTRKFREAMVAKLKAIRPYHLAKDKVVVDRLQVDRAKLRADLERQLQGVGKNVKIDAVLDKTSVAKAKGQLDALTDDLDDAKIAPYLDKRAAARTRSEFDRLIQDREATLSVRTDKGHARELLDELSSELDRIGLKLSGVEIDDSERDKLRKRLGELVGDAQYVLDDDPLMARVRPELDRRSMQRMVKDAERALAEIEPNLPLDEHGARERQRLSDMLAQLRDAETELEVQFLEPAERNAILAKAKKLVSDIERERPKMSPELDQYAARRLRDDITRSMRGISTQYLDWDEDIQKYMNDLLSQANDLEAEVKVQVDPKSRMNALRELRRVRDEFETIASEPVNFEPKVKVNDSFAILQMQRLRRSLEDSVKRLEPTLDDAKLRGQLSRLYDAYGKTEHRLSHDIMSPAEEQRLLHRLERIKDKIEDITEDRTTRIDFNVFSAWASARIKWLTRMRFVEVIPRVSKAALAKVMTTLAALSGARLTFHWADKFLNWVSDLDKRLPKLTLATTGLNTAFAALMGTLGGVVGLGNSLGAMLPSLLTLPGMLFGVGLSITAMVIAWKDASTVLEDLGDSWTELGEMISDNFWARAEEPVRRFSNAIMPQLQRSFAETAETMGHFTATFADAFREELMGGRLEAMFSGLTGFWQELERGADAFAGAIVNLGLVGSRWMPRLGAWITDLSIRFDNWLSDVSTDGRLDGWIEQSINEFYALWDVLAATQGIWAGFWWAAESAGFRGLRGIADVMLAWEKHVQGAKWQATLEAMFRGSRTAMAGFTKATQTFGNFLYNSRVEVEHFIGTAGQAFTGLFDDVFAAMDSPEFRQGLVKFIDGIKSGFGSLGEGAEPFVRMVAKLMEVIGKLAERIGPVLARALEAVEPLFMTLADAAMKVADVLGPVLEGTFRTLGRVIEDWGTTLGVVTVAVLALWAALKAKAAVTAFLGLIGRVSEATAAAGVSAGASAGKFGRLKGALGGWKGIGIAAAVTGVVAAAELWYRALTKPVAATEDLVKVAESGGNAWELMASRIHGSAAPIKVAENGLSSLKGSLQGFEKGASPVGTALKQVFSGSAAGIIRADAQLKEYGNSLAELAETNLPLAQEQFQKFADSENMSAEAAWGLLASSTDLKDALDTQLVSAGLAADSQNEYRLMTDKAFAASVSAKQKANEYAQTLEGMSGRVKPASDAVKELSDQLADFGGGFESVERNQIAWERGLDRLNEALETNGATLDKNTEAGRQNNELILDQKRFLQDQVKGWQANGDSIEEISEKYGTMRDALIDQIAPFYESRDAAEAYINELLATPEDLETKIRLEQEEARAKIQEFGQYLLDASQDRVAKLDADTAQADENVANTSEKLGMVTRTPWNAKVNALTAGALLATAFIQGKLKAVKGDYNAKVNAHTSTAQANLDSIWDTIKSFANQTFNTVVTVTRKIVDIFSKMPGHKDGGTVGVDGYASGGTIRGINGGVRAGTVYGNGTTKSDSVIVALSRGEEVIQNPYAAKFRPLLKMLNSGIIPMVESAPTIVVNVGALRQAQLALKSTDAAHTFRNAVGVEVGRGMLEGIAAATPVVSGAVSDMVSSVHDVEFERDRELESRVVENNGQPLIGSAVFQGDARDMLDDLTFMLRTEKRNGNDR